MDNLSMIHQFFDSLFIKVFIGNKAHIFGSVYRSPSNSLTSFIQSFKEVILDNLPMNLSTICGDFNLNLLNAPSVSGLDFVNNLNERNFNQLITLPTRPRTGCNANNRNNLGGTLIDHIWSSYTLDMRSFVIDYPISDHFPVMVTIQIPNINNKTRIEFRSFREEALKCSEEKLIELKSNFQLSPCNPNENANHFSKVQLAKCITHLGI